MTRLCIAPLVHVSHSTACHSCAWQGTVVELGHGSGGGISFRAAPVRNTLQHTAKHCNTLHRAASCCNSSEAASPSSLLRSATHCSTLQLTTTRCIALLLIRGGISSHTAPVSWHVCPHSPSMHILFCINTYVYMALLRIYTESFTHILQAVSGSISFRTAPLYRHVSHDSFICVT